MAKEPRPRPKILIVDDSDDYRATLKLYLQTYDYLVLETDDGGKALELSKINRPDLILMDIGLPSCSGLAAAYLIRKEHCLRHIPIIAITGFGNEELHEDALRAGCVECLTKPVDLTRLTGLINQLCVS